MQNNQLVVVVIELDACSCIYICPRRGHLGPKSLVKNKDLWTLEEDALFIKHCEDPRIQCY
jgi:hypothetical protein